MSIELFFNSVRNRRKVKGAGFYSSLASFPAANGSQGFALDESAAILYADIAGVWTSVSGGAGSYVLNRQRVEGAGFYADIATFPVANGSRGFALDESTKLLYADISSVWTPINSRINSVLDRARFYEYFNDFVSGVNVTNSYGVDFFFSNAGTGTANANQAIFTNNSIGLVSVATGTTAAGRATLQTSLQIMAFGQGVTIYEAIVMPAPFDISQPLERYSQQHGFIDTLAANQTDGAYFLYDTGGVSTGSLAVGYWQTVTAASPSRTFNAGTFTQITIAANTFYKLRVVINALGTEALFYVDGVLIATHTTNIPNGFNRSFGFGAQIIKNVGLTARPMYLDYIAVQQYLTVSR